MRDPTFAPAYRVLNPSADYEYHNVNMPMPRAIKSPNNLDTLKAAFGPTGSACKGCHDTYRKD